MAEITLTISAENMASQQFQKLRDDLKRTGAALKQFGTTSETGANKGAQAVKGFGAEMRKVGDAASGSFVTAARSAAGGFNTISDSVRRANPAVTMLRRQFQFLRNDVGNVAGVFRNFGTGLNNLVSGQVDAALEFERLRKSLLTVSGSAEEASDQYQRLIEVSKLPGLNLEQALKASVQLQAVGTDGREAANVITQFGNALALGGGSARDLNQIVNSIRQMSAEGKILQEDLSIMTTRVAVLVPVLKDAFGGTRAEDIRNAGVSTEEFLDIVTQALTELPRAGDTTANAIGEFG